MARTTFSGPVKSDNGFEGDITADALVVASNAEIGASATDTVGFFGATAVAQPTTAITAAAFSAGTSGIVDDSATFGGYTMGQVVAALKDLGLLA